METYNHKDLFDALKAEDSEKVKSLVEKYRDVIDINQFDENGHNALTITLYNADYKMTEYLIENFKDSIDINQVNEEGDTVLTREIGQVGIDIEDESEDEHEYSLILKLIFKKFSKVININQTNSEGDTLLMLACIHGCPNLVKYLIENFREAIDINQVNEDGNNALMFACNFEESSIDAEPHLEVVKYLIENFKEAININQINKDGNNALMIACDFEDSFSYKEQKSHFKVIKILTETYKGIIHINQTNKKGDDALTLASKNKYIVKFFTENLGNNIEEKNVEDESILPCALTEHIQSKEYKIKKFESIDTIFVKIGDVVHCYSKNNTIKYSGETNSKDKKQLLLNVDTGTGRYMKTDDEGVDVYRYHNRTDTILYS
jgi:ankyrin repeat protein